MSRCSCRRVAGLTLAVAALSPPLARILEQRMVTHMLLQIPALVLAGALCADTASASPSPSPSPLRRWNQGGVPGLLAASLVLAFWMTPIALDHAVSSTAWDAAKAASLLLAGAVGFASWRLAPAAVTAFFTGNLVWMTATIGLLYQDEGRRLCNAYLQDDQSLAGEALIALAVVAGTLWIAATLRFIGPADHRPAGGD